MGSQNKPTELWHRSFDKGVRTYIEQEMWMYICRLMKLDPTLSLSAYK